MKLHTIEEKLLNQAARIYPDISELDRCHFSVLDAVTQALYILIRNDLEIQAPKKSIWQHIYDNNEDLKIDDPEKEDPKKKQIN